MAKYLGDFQHLRSKFCIEKVPVHFIIFEDCAGSALNLADFGDKSELINSTGEEVAALLSPFEFSPEIHLDIDLVNVEVPAF